MSDGLGPRDGSRSGGWVSYLVDALIRAIFDPGWRAWTKLMITAIVVVGLYVLVKTYP